MLHTKIGMNSFERKCLHGCCIFEFKKKKLEYKVTFVKSTSH